VASVVLASNASAYKAPGRHAARSGQTSEYNLKNLPEIGTCVLGGGAAEYRGKKCTIAEPPAGKYNWRSGPGAKPKFAGPVTPPVELIPAGNASAKVTCTSGEIAGEYTGPKNMKITKLLLFGCQSNGTQCENKVGSTTGEMSTEELEGVLGFISHPTKLKVGWDLKPASGSNLAKFECGASETGGKSLGDGIPRELQGSAIGKVAQIDRMASEFVLSFELKKGAQLPEHFEGGVKDTLTTILGEKLPGTGKTPYKTTFLAKAQLKGTEQLEVLGRCSGSRC
jgi:hypothetical protein